MPRSSSYALDNLDEEERSQSEKARAADRARFLLEWQTALEVPACRKVLGYIVRATDIHEQVSYGESTHVTAFFNGKESMAKYILAQVMAANPDALKDIMTGGKNGG